MKKFLLIFCFALSSNGGFSQIKSGEKLVYAASFNMSGLMTQLAQESKVVIFASHNMAQVQRLANTVLFMQDGQILEIATPEQFFKNPQSKEATKFLAREFIAQ